MSFGLCVHAEKVTIHIMKKNSLVARLLRPVFICPIAKSFYWFSGQIYCFYNRFFYRQGYFSFNFFMKDLLTCRSSASLKGGSNTQLLSSIDAR